MAKTLELTWIAKLRQWRKRRFVNGKRRDFYLGTGNGREDRASYERALAKWRVKEAELDAADAETTLQRKYRVWGEMLAAREGISNFNLPPMSPPVYSQGDKLHRSLQRWLDGTARLGEDRVLARPKPEVKRLSPIGDAECGTRLAGAEQSRLKWILLLHRRARCSQSIQREQR